MAQAGIHSLVGVVVRKCTPARECLVLGIVLGNLLPDADNLAVAAATLTGASTEGLHRTFTHSLFTIAAIIIVFQLVAALTKRPSWGNRFSEMSSPPMSLSRETSADAIRVSLMVCSCSTPSTRCRIRSTVSSGSMCTSDART